MPGWLVVLLLLVLLGIAGWGSWLMWHQMQDVVIGMHGQIALGLGGALSLIITVFFMVLIYISRSRGFDDGAGRLDGDDEAPR